MKRAETVDVVLQAEAIALLLSKVAALSKAHNVLVAEVHDQLTDIRERVASLEANRVTLAAAAAHTREP